MVLPLIPIALISLAATGVAAGSKGASDLVGARRVSEEADCKYEKALAEHAEAVLDTQQYLSEYRARQAVVQETTLEEWLTWLETNERKVKRVAKPQVGDLNVELPDAAELIKLVDQVHLMKGSLKAGVVGYAARNAAIHGVRSFATAGTGTPIAQLSGTVAEKATLAWLGGGPLAAGGGGVAAGQAVLAGINLAPGIFIVGLTLGIEGSKAKTRATDYAADVACAAEEIQTQIALMERLRVRCTELWDVLDSVDDRARAQLAELTALQFDPDHHLSRLQATALLMAELAQILAAPLLDEDGQPSTGSFTTTERKAA